MQSLEERIQKFGYGNTNGVVPIKAISGHFATTHSHTNYYIDLTTLKSRSRESKQAAKNIAESLSPDMVIDTIICVDGTMVLGAYLAEILEQKGFASTNLHKTIYVIEPESTHNTQLIFRDNIIPMLREKNVLLLTGTISSGISFSKGIRCAEYYGAKVVGIASIFSNLSHYNDMEIKSIYSSEDIPDYHSYDPLSCPLCNQGIKVEAFVSAYGYSQLM